MFLTALFIIPLFATEYFTLPTLVDHYDATTGRHNLTFSGLLDTAQCIHDEVDCANSIILVKARFQIYPAESDYFWTNTIMMCDSGNDAIPPVFGPSVHMGTAKCDESNSWGEQAVHFKIPLKEPQPTALIKKAEIMVSIETPQTQNPEDYDEIFQQKIQRENMLLGRKIVQHHAQE